MNETDATAATDSTDFGASELPVTSRAGIEYVPPEAEFSAPSDLLSPPTSRAGAEYVPPRYDSFSQWFDSVRSSGAGVEAKATHEPDHGASLRSADPVVGFAVEAESYIALHRESRFL